MTVVDRRAGRVLTAARAAGQRHRTAMTIAGSVVAAAVLAYVLAGRRDEFATALASASIGVLAAAAALQVVALLARSEAWHRCIEAAGGTVDRRVLYRASSMGYVGSLLNAQLGVAARIGALTALTLLLRRERTGTGGAVSVAQSEVMLSHLAGEIAAEVLQRQGHARSDEPVHDAPWGLFPAEGEDKWVAVTVRDTTDWQALCGVIGRADLAADDALNTPAGRDADRARIDEAVRAWTSARTATAAMELLQKAGVPAGAVLHAGEVPNFGYYTERRAFREELHPHAAEPFMMENVQIHSDRVADPPLGQAPLLGEQTREIAAELLGLSDAEIDELIERGVLEMPQEVTAAQR